jgi:hypothetical protein
MPFDVHTLFEPRTGRLAASFAAVRGLSMTNDFEGTVPFAGATGTVRIEPGERVAFSVDGNGTLNGLTAAAAARRTALLPANLRITRDGPHTRVVGETLVDGRAHLPASLRTLLGGARIALRQREPAPPRNVAVSKAEHDALGTAVARLGWDDGAIVERDDGWELRPLVGGHVRPVEVRAEPGGSRLSHTLLPIVPEAVREIVCDFALRTNARIRLARIALDGESLVAEARLHGDLAREPFWIAETARAVASAALEADAVRLLADERETTLAHWYEVSSR